jgi:hypothetical protein
VTAPGTSATRPGLGPATLAALEEERDFLRTSLEDLERERAAGDIDDADYRALHDDYVARTAAVLRAIEARRAVPRAQPARRRRPWPVRTAVVAGVVAFGLGAGLLVARLAGTRTSEDSLTGDIRTSTAQELQRCLELASVAFRGGDGADGGPGEGAPGGGAAGGEGGELLGAVQCYSEVLARQPSNAQALAYRGWLLVRTGSPELASAGAKDLDAAVAADPTYPDARAFRAVVFYRLDQPEQAKAELDALDALGPPPIIGQILDQFGVREGVDAALRNGAGAPADGNTTSTAPTVSTTSTPAAS